MIILNCDEKCSHCNQCDKHYADNDGGAWCMGCDKIDKEKDE